ncbi:MAG: monovalent cation/H+ antiporter complex subunit F [Oscillochloridaceae bacterium]|nr:monovalent cation/H+ antiporter complex subunit F [Chloroflexaceae bacterium]MDW8388562.1 monovalent cation/H+ antiporter complex subunit F [Oscillochloridaceae bacterium]
MSPFQLTMTILMALLSISLGITFWRLVRGPSIPDRAVAFDMIMTHLVGLIAMFVVQFRQPILIDAVIVVSVLGFLGTVALARYIEEGRN